MALSCQKHLFALDPDVHYLNGAAYSPVLRRAVEEGMQGLRLKAETPYSISPQHHFETADRVRRLFSELVGAGDAERIALIPAVSYGMATVAQNLRRLPGISAKKRIVLIGEEFPNNVYAFERVGSDLGLSILTVEKPESFERRGAAWNERLLEAITAQTALVVASRVHWIYGTRFDLEAIGRRCRENGALLVVDATQSVGAMPFEVQSIQPDAVICAAYKWLLGPYGTAVAYFGPFFDEGIPIEESWMNRAESDQFARLTRYERAYRPKAQRYNAGEFSQFAQLPILETSLRQILAWDTSEIQSYCGQLCETAVSEWQALGCRVEDPAWRAAHLFGISLPEKADSGKLLALLAKRKVYVSLRGDAVRVSPNVYNDGADMAAFAETLREILNQ